MQLLGVAFLLLALLAWNAATGDLTGLETVALPAVVTFLPLLLIARGGNVRSPTLVVIGGLLGAAIAVVGAGLIPRGSGEAESASVLAAVGLLVGCGVGCLVPLNRRRRYY